MAAVVAVDRESPPVGVCVDWERVERWLGVRLPGDYKALADAWGPADFGGHLWLHVPCRQEGRFDYGEWLRSTHRMCRILSRESGACRVPEFRPAEGGLLAWGTTRAAEELFWDTSAADPDRWTVTVFRRDALYREGNPWWETGLTLSEFLAAVVRGPVRPADGGEGFGPLPAVVARNRALTGPGPWTPPPRRVPLSPELRRFALETGTGTAALRVLVPPPPDRPRPGEPAWPEVSERLGTGLPREYAELMELYGAGEWGGWLRFYDPLDGGGSGLVARSRADAQVYRELRAEFPEECPLPVWPEPGGLLSFADSADGDVLGWLTEGEPDSWPLVVWPRHAGQGPPLHGMTLTGMLLSWLRGEGRIPGLPALDEDDDPLEFAVFRPWEAPAGG
ncbi:hypothetical protein SAMN05421773_101352 [Streptomyces aidingensis]|uniref:SMI1-KNR4 cell-wall n=2 Tax=Streptomyces aidingensis TaxID=910347 RepID=A0A1I1EKT7_9ACTN|nr:hypothetical protein SAMN05421773_101352 [Streptomyces aidingensis]